eukprot:5808501-Prymnesium_polylepis.1
MSSRGIAVSVAAELPRLQATCTNSRHGSRLSVPMSCYCKQQFPTIPTVPKNCKQQFPTVPTVPAQFPA